MSRLEELKRIKLSIEEQYSQPHTLEPEDVALILLLEMHIEELEDRKFVAFPMNETENLFCYVTEVKQARPSEINEIKTIKLPEIKNYDCCSVHPFKELSTVSTIKNIVCGDAEATEEEADIINDLHKYVDSKLEYKNTQLERLQLKIDKLTIDKNALTVEKNEIFEHLEKTDRELCEFKEKHENVLNRYEALEEVNYLLEEKVEAFEDIKNRIIDFNAKGW